MKKLNKNKLTEKLTSIIDLSISEGKTLGSSCQINQFEKPVVKIVRGAATLEGEPLREDHIFRLASMTKNITAVPLLQQIEQGKLALDTEVAHFFPGFRNKWVGNVSADGDIVKIKKAETPMTIKHLVTHTNGLFTGSVGQMHEIPEEDGTTIASVVDYYEREAVLDFSPGSKWGYSGIAAFDIICRIVELLSDMTYDDYVKTYVTGPLAMPDTVFIPNKSQWLRMVDVLDRDSAGNAIRHAASEGRVLFGSALSRFNGGGGMTSTICDYMRFNEMLLNEGELDGKRVLSESSVKTMHTPLIPQGMEGMFFPHMTFGVCCYVRKNVSHMPDGCYGWGGAYGTYMWIDPENSITAVWMKNSMVLDNLFSPTGEKIFETTVYEALE